MRTLLFTTAAAAALSTIGILSPAAHAQNPAGANASKHGVAVVDISYIFQKHERLSAVKEKLKQEMQQVETELKADSEKIESKKKQREAYNVGSPEYRNLDEEIARMMADFSLKMNRLRKSFMEREAKLYYQTYMEISQAVSQYATRHDIGLVLRFNGDKPDPNRSDEVMRDINKAIVFQNQIDITPDILAMLNRGTPTTATPGARPGSQLPPR